MSSMIVLGINCTSSGGLVSDTGRGKGIHQTIHSGALFGWGDHKQTTYGATRTQCLNIMLHFEIIQWQKRRKSDNNPDPR